MDVDVGQIPIGHGRRERFGTKLKLLEYVVQPVDTDLARQSSVFGTGHYLGGKSIGVASTASTIVGRPCP